MQHRFVNVALIEIHPRNPKLSAEQVQKVVDGHESHFDHDRTQFSPHLDLPVEHLLELLGADEAIVKKLFTNPPFFRSLILEGRFRNHNGNAPLICLHDAQPSSSPNVDFFGEKIFRATRISDELAISKRKNEIQIRLP
ncbi:hypothetical protein DESC_740247 [Desulfosarcina cetonica]|nr:hypothetical protein DESC_740247 [Desulfosarcina cetonica]